METNVNNFIEGNQKTKYRDKQVRDGQNPW